MPFWSVSNAVLFSKNEHVITRRIVTRRRADGFQHTNLFSNATDSEDKKGIRASPEGGGCAISVSLRTT